MTETKFTPGPWGIFVRPNSTILVLERDADGNPKRHIAEMSWAELEGGMPDAAIIAAAPDLYAALKVAQLWLDTDGRFDMQGINAALAKARGES